MKRLFVGNLSFDSTEESIREAFEPYGRVESVTIIVDRATGHSRGFGFVEMGSSGEAENAINSTNGLQLDGRPITVSEAREKNHRNQVRYF